MTIRPIFQRSDGRTLSVDTDLWLCALDLALVHGWKPSGTMSPDDSSASSDPFAYHQADGRRILSEDAAALAAAFEAGLRDVPDALVPLQGKSFGEEHTSELLALASTGRALDAELCAAATEILSGPAKSEARALLEFLRGGEVSIGSAPTPVGAKRAPRKAGPQRG